MCALLVGESGRVLAFEPNAENVESIERQIAVNGNLPIAGLAVALTSESGVARFDVSAGCSQGCIAPEGAREVETRTLDSLVAGGAPPPDLLKLDVEGHEIQVLDGAMNVLSRFVPIVVCGYHDGTTLDLLRRKLILLGYKVSEGPPIVCTPGSLMRC